MTSTVRAIGGPVGGGGGNVGGDDGIVAAIGATGWIVVGFAGSVGQQVARTVRPRAAIGSGARS